jgi:hypothetical protein
MNGRVGTKACDVLFIEDEGRADDATHECAMKVRMFSEHRAISIDEGLTAVTEDGAGSEIDTLNVVSIDGRKALDITSIVGVQLFLSTLFRCSKLLCGHAEAKIAPYREDGDASMRAIMD